MEREWNDTVGLSRSLMTITHTRLSLVSLSHVSLSLSSLCLQPKKTKMDYAAHFENANPLAIDLLDKMLQFDPANRITVEDVRLCLLSAVAGLLPGRLSRACVCAVGFVRACCCMLASALPLRAPFHNSSSSPPPFPSSALSSVSQALTHKYMETLHNAEDEPLCQDVFDFAFEEQVCVTTK